MSGCPCSVDLEDADIVVDAGVLQGAAWLSIHAHLPVLNCQWLDSSSGEKWEDVVGCEGSTRRKLAEVGMD